jgi:hypothetical protein
MSSRNDSTSAMAWRGPPRTEKEHAGDCPQPWGGDDRWQVAAAQILEEALAEVLHSVILPTR